jgi:hypothetical protein
MVVGWKINSFWNALWLIEDKIELSKEYDNIWWYKSKENIYYLDKKLIYDCQKTSFSTVFHKKCDISHLLKKKEQKNCIKKIISQFGINDFYTILFYTFVFFSRKITIFFYGTNN